MRRPTSSTKPRISSPLKSGLASLASISHGIVSLILIIRIELFAQTNFVPLTWPTLPGTKQKAAEQAHSQHCQEDRQDLGRMEHSLKPLQECATIAPQSQFRAPGRWLEQIGNRQCRQTNPYEQSDPAGNRILSDRV